MLRPPISRYLSDYYSLLGDFAEQIAASARTSPQQVAGTVAAVTETGCTS